MIFFNKIKVLLTISCGASVFGDMQQNVLLSCSWKRGSKMVGIVRKVTSQKWSNFYSETEKADSTWDPG
jgi:hypothetical protein